MKYFTLTMTFILLTSFHAKADADQSLVALNDSIKIVKSLPDMSNYRAQGDDDPKLKAMGKVSVILTDAVKDYLEDSTDQRLLEQILLVASELNKKDPYQSGSVSLEPLYKKAYGKKPNAALRGKIEKALGTLPPADAKNLLKSMVGQSRYSEQGG